MQLVEDFEFGDPGSDDLPGPLIHGFGAFDSPPDHGEFVGILVSSQLPEFGFDIHKFGRTHWVHDVLEMWPVRGEFDADMSVGRTIVESVGQYAT